MRPSIPTALCALLAGLLFAGLVRSADAQPDRPEGSRRQVRIWDFEDAPEHGEPIPIDWFRAQDSPPLRPRPTFPSWNVPSLDESVAAGGRFSVRLPTRGGSASLMLSTGVVAAIPDGDYIISAQARTDQLRHARARLVAWFLDENLARIPGSESFSEPVISEGQWTTLEAQLRGDQRSSWIQIELQLLQPRDQGGQSAKSLEVEAEDFRGSAWFDDVTIYQTPRVNLRAAAPAGIFVGAERPTLLMLVRDLTGENLSVQTSVYDLDGRLVQRVVTPAPPMGRESSFVPNLPAFGWYRATIRVTSGAVVIGERAADLLWVPDPAPMNRESRQSFALVAERLTPRQRDKLPALLERVQTGAVTLAAWDESTRPSPTPEELRPLARVIDRLVDDGQEITFSLALVPEELARQARVDRDDPLPIFQRKGDEWQPSLDALLSRFGERVRRWQFGPSGSGLPFRNPSLAAHVETAQGKLRRLVPRPLIAVPWRLEQAPPPLLSSQDAQPIETLSLWWPPAIPAHSIGQYMEAWPSALQTRLVIETLDERVYGRAGAVIDLARRAALAWQAGITHIALSEPWRFDEKHAEADFQPRAVLGAWRTLAEALGGRRIVGELSVAQGVTALIARGADSSALIAWNDSAPADKAVIRGHLGPGPITVRDLFGNRSPVEPSPAGDHSIELGDAPIIIEGVDVELLQFRAAMRIEPHFIPARAERHRVELVIENPWPIGITGRLRIAEPGDWTILPRVMPINLAPGATARLPIDLSFNVGEEAGTLQVLAEVDLRAGIVYPLQRLPLSLEIGLPSVELIPSFRYERISASRTDVLVMVRVINLTDKPLTLQAFAQAPGFKSFDAPISDLAAGASITRFFRFENGGARLKGRSIRVGLREQDGSGRLNKTIAIE